MNGWTLRGKLRNLSTWFKLPDRKFLTKTPQGENFKNRPLSLAKRKYQLVWIPVRRSKMVLETEDSNPADPLRFFHHNPGPGCLVFLCVQSQLVQPHGVATKPIRMFSNKDQRAWKLIKVTAKPSIRSWFVLGGRKYYSSDFDFSQHFLEGLEGFWSF